jgi:hypothetical protein
LYLQYNLTVDDAHTFFVGEQAWLVHNICWTYGSKQAQSITRGWTQSDIQNTVDNPAQTLPSPRGNLATGNSATIYYRSDGHYVILDDVTLEIVQVSNIYDSGWLDEGTGNTTPIRNRP